MFLARYLNLYTDPIVIEVVTVNVFDSASTGDPIKSVQIDPDEASSYYKW
jgi:hypothetical protein